MIRRALPLFALLLAATPPASANDSVYGGCSGTMSGVSAGADCVPVSQPDIALVDEKLSIRARLADASIVATYTFENTGSAATVTVGFPVDAPSEPEGEDDPPKAVPPLKQYVVTLDGKPLKHRIFYPHVNGSDAAKGAARTFGYDAVYLVDVPFKAGQKRVLEHRYSTRETFMGYAYAAVRYILRTGANWRGGTIGRIAIAVTIDEPISRGCLRSSLPGTTFDVATRTFVFNAEAWKPEHDLYATFVPAGAMAQIHFGSSETLPDTTSLGEMSHAAAVKALSALKTDDVLAAYTAVLQIFSAIDTPAGDDSLCDAEIAPVALKWSPDPTITVKSFPKWAQTYLKAAHAVLTAAKVAHPSLKGL